MLEFDWLGYVDWAEVGSDDIARRAIMDVARALGYLSYGLYNAACVKRIDDVRARLAAL